jgi:hypothetical protein
MKDIKDNNKLTPICLFVYSRINETRQTVESLQKNILASESQLFVFSDGAKNESMRDEVKAVRNYIRTISGFESVTIYESEINKGLANSIISGVTQIVNEYGKVIVIEDDLIFSTNFLCFMNEALSFYEDKKEVLNISGYSFDLKYPKDYSSDAAFSLRFASWGWAIWKDRWNQIDWELKDYDSFKWNVFKLLKFSRGGSDLCCMLHRQMHGKIDSWAIRLDYHHFKYNYLDVFPIKSKVMYNGFSMEATHTKMKCSTYDTILDITDQRTFTFPENLKIDKHITKQFYKHYSLSSRFKDKFSQLLWKTNK